MRASSSASVSHAKVALLSGPRPPFITVSGEAYGEWAEQGASLSYAKRFDVTRGG